MAIREGYSADLEKILSRLEILNKLDLTMSTYWGASFANYSIAVILTQLGELDKAITYLKRTRDLGSAMNLIFFNYDPGLAPLYDRPDFKKLNEPRWPDVKD